MSPVFEKCTALVVVTEKSGRAASLIIIRRMARLLIRKITLPRTNTT